jgi:hypothetical protein
MLISDALVTYANNLRTRGERQTTIGASEIGACVRKTFYAKHGNIEHNPEHVDGWGATLRGNVIEKEFWLPALRARFGDRLKFAGEQQQTFALEFLSATPDGLLVGLPRNALTEFGIPDLGEAGELVVEGKTLDPRARLDGPRPEHIYQAQVQLGLLRELTGHRPHFALISYIDASFWDIVTEFVIAFDPAVYAAAKARAAKVLTATAAAELSPEGWIAGGHECERCPFTKICGIERRAMPSVSTAAANPQLVAEIRDLAITYKARQGEAEAAASKVRDVGHEIRERLRAKGLRQVAGDDFSVIWSPVKGRQGFDVKALSAAAAAAGVDVSKFETIADPGDRLDIRVREARAQ